MPRRKWIDKKSAAHFTLVHRPQNDPRIHDESAPAMVLNPTQAPNAGGSSTTGTSVKSRRLDDLASQLGSDVDDIRDNEGEAANFGVFFDDSSYDYMQHLREIGQGGGEAVFVESTASLNAAHKSRQKTSLADALQQMDLQHRSEELLDADILPAKALQRVTYQNQQDVPDAIAGFQPDLDPRLREVLEALEDEAYVDDDESNDDLFQQLAKDGEELDQNEFEDQYDDDDDGWESDATEKPVQPRQGFEDSTTTGNGAAQGDADDADDEARDTVPELVDLSGAAAAPPPETEGADDWMEDFKKFKKDQSTTAASGAPKKKITPAMSDVQSSIWTTNTAGGRKKKRKGALTEQSGFSMTSSSLVRTEQMSLLDARFDKIDELYNNDAFDEDGFGDDMKSVSAFSTTSSVQGPLRNDFNGIMDEFLGGYSMQGKRAIKKGRQQTGLEQLDEIRRGLGPARLSTRKK
ncbi:protein LTV1 [Sporothrix brasiliensis 5110]|uniref:Protein LTV1 n=1 Tax=Sporothrix brasiliensis 5110 TaxID=1398154 RepID=A0A0C2IVP6_9PEZI|nr:protein LTV1 [Sporothrix brasiliensis 5110]KIH90875.1 protein LTV1 [Sporothrix brasiliensis 5110]